MVLLQGRGAQGRLQARPPGPPAPTLHAGKNHLVELGEAVHYSLSVGGLIKGSVGVGVGVWLAGWFAIGVGVHEHRESLCCCCVLLLHSRDKVFAAGTPQGFRPKTQNLTSFKFPANSVVQVPVLQPTPARVRARTHTSWHTHKPVPRPLCRAGTCPSPR
jgi:hypothetical protein